MYSDTLFLHGFTGSRASWRRVVAACPLHAGLVCVDLPGHGDQPQVAAGFVENLQQILESLSDAGTPGAPVRICGYSLGARVALGLLELAPAMVAELVLCGVHPGIDDHAERQTRKRADANLAQGMRAHGLDAFVEHWDQQPIFASQQELAPELRAEQNAIRRAQDCEGLARSLEEMGLGSMPSYRDTLASTDTPVSLIVGERDPKFLEIARELGLPLRIVPGVGHNVPLEAPEAVAEILFPN